MFGAGIANAHNAAQNQAALANMLGSSQSTLLGADKSSKAMRSQTVFNGRINVEKVANGYVINISVREGYEFDTYIASTIQEVNERIAASMVSFQLENK
jgi:gas vesicle protein